MKRQSGKSKTDQKRIAPKSVNITYTKVTTMEDIIRKFYGKRGTKKRNEFEKEMHKRSKTYATLITLKSLRQNQNLTQKQVSQLMNVDQPVVSRLEKDFNNSHLSTILRYAEAIGATQINLTFEFNDQPAATIKLTTK